MVKAVILIGIEPNKTSEVFDSVEGMDGVKEALQTYGEYDASFIIETENVEGIQNFVKNIRKISGINRTVTLIEVA